MKYMQSRKYWLLSIMTVSAMTLGVTAISAQASGIDLISPANGASVPDNETNTVHFQFTTSGSCINSYLLINSDGEVDDQGMLTGGSFSRVPEQDPGQPCIADLSAPTGLNYWQAYGSDCGSSGGPCLSGIQFFSAPVWIIRTYIDPSTVSWERPPEPPRCCDTSTSSPKTQSKTVALTVSGFRSVHRILRTKAIRKAKGRIPFILRLSWRATLKFKIHKRSGKKLHLVKRWKMIGNGGSNQVKIKIPHIKPGRYTVTVKASDSAGNTSKPKKAGFRVQV